MASPSGVLAAVQAVRKEGIYADGVATLQTLPEALHGPDAAVDVQLRLLLEGERLSEDQVTEHASKECQKVCLQPSVRILTAHWQTVHGLLMICPLSEGACCMM